MSHHSQRVFVRSCAHAFPEFFRDVSVLEIGSGNINGSPRYLFSDARYVGVDVVPGPGVDLVGSGHEIRVDPGKIDIALSCECFEHNPYWRETLANMISHLRAGGMFVVTCGAPGRPEHGTPRSQPSHSLSAQLGWDYYRNVSRAELEETILSIPRMSDFRIFHRVSEADIYFLGVVEPLSSDVIDRLRRFEPRWESDKSWAERVFMMVSGILETHLHISPYQIHRCHDRLSRIYDSMKKNLRGHPRCY